MFTFERRAIAAVSVAAFATLIGCAAPVEDSETQVSGEAEQGQGSDAADTENFVDEAPDSNVAVIIGGGGHRAGAHRAHAYRRSPFYPGNRFHRRGPWRTCDTFGRCW